MTVVDGRVRSMVGRRFMLWLDGVELVGVGRPVGLVTVSPDLLDPFSVVGAFEPVEATAEGVLVAGELDDVAGSVSTRRVRGLLAGRRVSRFVVEGLCLRLLHPHLEVPGPAGAERRPASAGGAFVGAGV